jgi:hypothetical protein
MKLNAPGAADGLYRLWADDSLIAQRTNVDLRGSLTNKINEMMLDCYWNGGSPRAQSRYYDNLVVSTTKIGPATGMAVRYNGRRAFSRSGTFPHCSLILVTDRRFASNLGEAVFDIRGRRLQKDQVRPGGIVFSVTR